MLELPWVRDSRDWQYIAFGEVYNCLRGSRKLKIPPNWRGVTPDRLGDVKSELFHFDQKKFDSSLVPRGSELANRKSHVGISRTVWNIDCNWKPVIF